MENSIMIPFGEPVWVSAEDDRCFTTHWEEANGLE